MASLSHLQLELQKSDIHSKCLLDIPAVCQTRCTCISIPHLTACEHITRQHERGCEQITCEHHNKYIHECTQVHAHVLRCTTASYVKVPFSNEGKQQCICCSFHFHSPRASQVIAPRATDAIQILYKCVAGSYFPTTSENIFTSHTMQNS